MANLLTALASIRKQGLARVPLINPISSNRINVSGEYLEHYVKYAFSDSFGLSKAKAILNYQRIFSWQGSQNNPPDIILRGGDAIEVKKLESVIGREIALNSSMPKQHLFSSDPKISKACRECETDWRFKDIIYAVGNMGNKKIARLFFVYGDCYAANQKIYQRMFDSIKGSISSAGIELDETKELGRVNRVDPLCRTYLRIRGMWGISVPFRCFEEFISKSHRQNSVFALMTEKKYASFPKKDRDALCRLKGVSSISIRVPSPDNPSKMLKARLITF